MASTSLTFTQGTATNAYKYTISFWVKRSKLGVSHLAPFTAGTYESTNMAQFLFTSNDNLLCQAYTGTPTLVMQQDTNMKFRDTSAWYHIVLAVDTTQATASDRQTLYVNGEEITSLSANTSFPQNSTYAFNESGFQIMIGNRAGMSYYLDGSMTHIHFIDGTAYAASDFGEIDSTTGIWKPKTAPSVTYGNNGFFLKFENSGSMGTDSSGNANNFTVSGNLTQTVDTPSNVFCTINALSKGSGITLSNGNTTITNGATWYSAMATIMPSTGKWYWENKVSSLGTVNCGVTKSTQDGTTHSSVDAGRSMYSSNGTVYNEGLASSDYATGTTFTTNDVIGVAIDIAGDSIAYYKNGSLIHTVSDSGISSAEGWSPAWGMNSGTFNVNFGNGYFGTTAVSSATTDESGLGTFEYTVPSGYYALCTKNINTQEYS